MSTRQHRTSLGRISVSALMLTASCASDSLKTEPPHPPLNEQPVQESSAGVGWPDAYRLRIEAGEFIRLAIHQQGIDVLVRLIHPDGSTLLEEDSPTGSSGTENLLFVAAESGVYKVEISPLRKEVTKGRFEIELQAHRPATLLDRVGLLFWQAERLDRSGDLLKALDGYREALHSWQRLGKPLLAGKALSSMGACALRLWDEGAAIIHYRQAIEVFSAAGSAEKPIEVRIELGKAFKHFGAPDEAFDAFSQALAAADESGYLLGQVYSRHQIGLLHRDWGETEKASKAFEEAIRLNGQLGDMRRKARLQTELGRTLSLAERHDEAKAVLQQALDSWGKLESSRIGKCNAITELGWLEHLDGDHQKAIESLLEALRLIGEDHPQAAGIWDRLGSAYRSFGLLPEALHAFQKATFLMDGRISRFVQAHTLNNLAETFLELKNPQEALQRSEEAAALFGKSRQRHAEAYALFVSATALQALGRWQEARQRLEEVLDAVESLRYKVSGRAWRGSFQGAYHFYFEEYWNLLAAFPEHLRGQELARAGFEAMERVRSLTFREWITEKDAAPDSSIRKAEYNILERIAARDRRKLELADQGAAESRLTDIDEALSRLLNQLDLLGAPAPEPVSLSDVQERLLDEGTLLLAYVLGEKQSFLWVVSESEVRMHPLPDRNTIERLALLCHNLLRRPSTLASRGQLERAIYLLSEILLKDVLPSLRTLDEPPKRLLIVADGALHYVPFAVLDRNSSDPSLPYRPILTRHEITMLPSAGALLELLDRKRPQPKKLFAVVADPVFSLQDLRLGSRAVRGSGNRPTVAFPRLPFEPSILGLVPPEQPWTALGFEATREMVVSGKLKDFSIVHFGTHGVFHPDRPELSHILLSLVDQGGNPIPGILRAHDIARLQIFAQLVTLSACETGKGEQIRGEGVLGLAHSFMVAGASRVAVSLWKVHNQATDELMRRFYKGILSGKLSPPAALQAAQLSMMEDPKWSSPFYWAGFVLLGDWRPLPETQ